MEYFWKATAAVIITVILGLVIGKREHDFSMLLTITVSSMAAAIAIGYFEPILDFLWELEKIGNLQNEMVDLLLKAVGISLITELAVMICTDAGFGALGKSLQLLGSVVIFGLSLPAMKNLLWFIQGMLGEL